MQGHNFRMEFWFGGLITWSNHKWENSASEIISRKTISEEFPDYRSIHFNINKFLKLHHKPLITSAELRIWFENILEIMKFLSRKIGIDRLLLLKLFLSKNTPILFNEKNDDVACSFTS